MSLSPSSSLSLPESDSQPRLQSDDPCDGLVRRALLGDNEAFADLIACTQQRLAAYVATHAMRGHVADEIVQDTYVACYEGLQAYAAQGRFIYWLCGIARNLLRQRLRQDARLTCMEPAMLTALYEDEQHDTRQDDAHIDRQHELLHGLELCLQQMPKRARGILEGFYHGLSLKQLAQKFSQKSATLAVKISRMRKALHTCLETRGLHL